MSLSTGWWGVPGDLSGARSSKVHIAHRGAPFCGVRIGRRMAFQFCSATVVLPMVECGHCRRKWLKQASQP